MKLSKEAIPQAWKDHDKSIKNYLWSHRVLSYTKSALGLFLLAFGFFSFRLGFLEVWVEAQVEHPFSRWLLYLFIIGAFWEIVSLPFSIGHHSIERSHKLSKQTYGNWFWDKIKGYFVGGIIGTIALAALYLCVIYSENYWWLTACVLFIGLSIVLAQLAPVLLIPIFFKLHPMEPNPLKERLLNLCKKYGIDVFEVYHLGMGDKTEKGNAAFVGLGKTKRIMIGDTLYKKHSPEEVEAVFAHELGHQLHNDLWKGIGFSSVTMFMTFYVAKALCETWVLPYSESNFTDPMGIFLFFIVLGIVQIPVGVLQAAFTRRMEVAADDFAYKKIGVGKSLADSLEKLTIQNRSQFYPNPLREFLSFSHPAPWRRILRLRS